MGSRAQIFIEDTGVYLYSHFGTSNMLEILHLALERQDAVFDMSNLKCGLPESLTAMVAYEMTVTAGHCSLDALFGTPYVYLGDYCGIGTERHGDLDLLVTVNYEKETIKVERDIWLESKKKKEPPQCTFEEFLKGGPRIFYDSDSSRKNLEGIKALEVAYGGLLDAVKSHGARRRLSDKELVKVVEGLQVQLREKPKNKA